MRVEPESYPSEDGLARERNWWKWALVEVEVSRWCRRRRERKERICRREPDTVEAEAGLGLVKWRMEMECGNQMSGRKREVATEWGPPLKFKIRIRQNGKGCLQTPAKLLNRQMMQI